MKFRQLLLFVVAFLGGTVPTTLGFSQQQSSSDAGGQIFKFAFSKMPYTASARSDLAKLYLAYCRDILVAIPTNTPAEEAWVAEEANTTQFDKINRLYHTKEFARSKLKETFSSCVSTASDLVLAQSTKDRDLEAAFFIKLA
jgi:hypothetical protein